MSVRQTPSLADFRSFYAGKRVLVTGHTGFKGGWLALWLAQMGAEVHGIALPPDQGPNSLYEKAGVGGRTQSRFLDIRDKAALQQAFDEIKPTIVFHLAAFALVQQGYEDPIGTFETNTIGTANVLEASRRCGSVHSIVCVTTDKVYLNKEWAWPYRETDELGGLDPYSASKAAAELVARAWQKALKPKDRPFAIATARGGNVIGGGDWSPHRLIPDIVRAIDSRTPLVLRYPGATRPWQHVLDLCYGYLLLGYRLATDSKFTDIGNEAAWNFGPSSTSELTVREIVTAFLDIWGEPTFPVELGTAANYEAMTLRLDPSRALHLLGWQPGLDARGAITWSAEWYQAYLSGKAPAADLVFQQIAKFEDILGRFRPSASGAEN